MLYVKEEMPETPKWEAIEEKHGLVSYLLALGVWTRLAADSRLRLTDGAITHHRIRKLTGGGPEVQQALQHMVQQRLLETTKQGFQIHDWADHQETKAQVEQRRRKDRTKKRKQRRKASTSPRDAQGDTTGDSPVVVAAESEGVGYGMGWDGEGRDGNSIPETRARGPADVARATSDALNADPTDAEVARHWNLVAQAAGSAGHPLKHYRDDFAMLAGFARRQLPGQPWRDFFAWYWGEEGWAGKHPHLAKPASLVKSWDQSVREWRDPIAFAASKDRDKPRPLTRQEREDDAVIADIMRAAAAREAGHG